VIVLFLWAVFESSLFGPGPVCEKEFNPASLADKKTAFKFYLEQRFGLEDLKRFGAGFQFGSYRCNLSSFGNELYRENLIGLGFGYPAAQFLDIGFALSILNYWIENYTNQFSYSLMFGAKLQHHPVEISGWAGNLNIPRFSQIDYLPPVYSMGINYQGTKDLHFLIFVKGVETNLPFFNFGFTYSPYQITQLGFGVNTEPLSIEYYFKINPGNFIFTYFGNSHYILGLSHSLGVGFIF